MTYEQAIELIKPIVGDSNIAGQKFVDFTLADPKEREECQVAMMIIRQEVEQGRVSEEDVKSMLGLMV